eukprot:8823113-Alexandrium_andersonii.AAC.1
MDAALQELERCQVRALHFRDFAGVLDDADCRTRRALVEHHEHGANNGNCPARACTAVDHDAFVGGYG